MLYDQARISYAEARHEGLFFMIKHTQTGLGYG